MDCLSCRKDSLLLKQPKRHAILTGAVRPASIRCPPIVHSPFARRPTFWTEVFICRRVFLQYGKSLSVLVQNEEIEGFKPDFFLKNNCFCVSVGENDGILPAEALLPIILWTVLPNRAILYNFLGIAGKSRLQTAVRNCWEKFSA